ncbi:DUF882 domain-containing protein [Crocinitomix catalasitica]|nr:DUF882 domain-containing protein [Crocinitomix catalasitica]
MKILLSRPSGASVRSHFFSHIGLGPALLLLIAISCKKKTNTINIYDEKHPQEDVLTRDGIDSVLNSFEQIPYPELSEAYKDSTDPQRKFTKELNQRELYVITGDEIYKKVIGNYRLKDFLAKDSYYKQNAKNFGAKHAQFWLIDKKVLYMMLELIHRLDEEGYNMYGFHIRNSHRHPAHNKKARGAKYSQHMFGRAIDIGVDDVNKDGKSNLDDKAILYDLLEDIVSNEGGLGLYPGKMCLHFDCRGHRARWDWP